MGNGSRVLRFVLRFCGVKGLRVLRLQGLVRKDARFR